MTTLARLAVAALLLEGCDRTAPAGADVRPDLRREVAVSDLRRIDGGGGESGALDLRRDATVLDPALDAPRPVAPLSTTTATSRRPTLRWKLASGTDGARVELCADRACAKSALSFVAPGASGRPPTDLADGVWWWRLKGRAGGREGTRTGPAWELFVRSPRSPTVDSAWGNAADIDGDGRADILVGADWANLVRLHPGGPGGPSTQPLLLTAPGGGAGYFGAHVSATDVNGDGLTDLFIGAPAAKNASGTELGKVFVYLNGAGGIQQSTPTVLVGGDEKGSFGVLAGVGDVDGDGYGDLAVAAPGAKVGGSFLGKLFVYRGGPAGLAPTPATTIQSDTGGNLGFSVAAAGDVNGDGFADIVVGTYAADKAVVYYGGPSGIQAAAATTISGEGGQFGWSVAGAGDVNGDGYADVLVGALQADSGKGRAYIFLGGAAGVGSIPTVLEGKEPGGNFGHAVSGAGDLDGDGHADVIVGAYLQKKAHVFLGGQSGPPAITLGAGTEISFGSSVAGVGDLDGDGLAEVAVAAPEAVAGPRVYIHRGTKSGVATTPTWTLTGLAGSHFGINIGKTY